MESDPLGLKFEEEEIVLGTSIVLNIVKHYWHVC